MALSELEEYKCIRQETKSEYDLLSGRLGWLLSSHAFLFSAMALGIKSDIFNTLQNSSTIFIQSIGKIYIIKSSIFFPILAWLGLIVSEATLISIFGALLRISIWEAKEVSFLKKNRQKYANTQ